MNEPPILEQEAIDRGTGIFLADALLGLRRTPKEISSKYLYDARGSALFEEITTLDEYYLTRVETGILRENAAEMAERLGPGCRIVEYGSGSGVKTKILLAAMPPSTVYVPVDISPELLLRAASEIATEFPHIEVLPVAADFTQPIRLPAARRSIARTAVFFPGSTIGNFDTASVIDLFERAAETCGDGGAMLVGVDLTRDPSVLARAYDDPRGVTAAFNLNLLERMNRELGADFDPSRFFHETRWNEEDGRIEMHLVSRIAQTVTIAGHAIRFAAGETLHTENSYKYSPVEFRIVAGIAGWSVERAWTDPEERFAEVLLGLDAI
jgi:L-histidine N-alpha-methyltransferase